MGNLHETDTVLWAERQADALRRHAYNEIDWENVAEEIEDVGNRHRDRIKSRLATLCNRIEQVTEDYRSLRSHPANVLTKSYGAGRRVAFAETGLTDLPDACPWSIEQILDHGFWPGQ